MNNAMAQSHFKMSRHGNITLVHLQWFDGGHQKEKTHLVYAVLGGFIENQGG